MTISESLQIDTSRFTRIVPDVPAPSSPEQDLLPGRDPHLRFTAPFLPGIFPSSDTLRGFHLGGKIPQFRIPVPPQSPAQGAGSTSTTVVASSSSSSSSTTTNNPPEAQTASIASSVLNPGDQFLGTILLAKSFYLYTVSVSVPARVRLYSTFATQTLDQFRDSLTSPGLGTQQGLILDVNLDTAPITWICENASGSNADIPQTNVVYITIDNIGLASTAIDVSIVYVPTQS